VFDGDTIRANCGGELKRVRFACIDAPELKQENGVASRDHLRSLLNRSENQVILQPIATDRFGRTVAEVYANGQLVQLEQAKAGMVWAYERYKRDCPHWAEVDKAFRAAKANGRGIFLRGNTIPPWQWRRIWDK
jgi:endonuclease YncB( thermonuclease family)